MRKFNVVSHVDSTTFRPKMYIGLQTSDGTFEELSMTNIYTRDQKNIINATNTALVNKGLPVLTEEEIDCMFGLGKYDLINDKKDYAALVDGDYPPIPDSDQLV